MRNDNKGLSLIELIVIVAIMGVMLGAIGLSFKAVADRRVSKAAYSTKSMIKMAQTYAKSTDGVGFVVLEGTGNGIEVFIKKVKKASDITDESKWETGYGPEALNSRISAKVYFVNGSNKFDYEINKDDKVILRFNKKLGSFTKECYYVAADGTVSSEGYPEKIEFFNGDKTISLVMAYNTGGIYMTTEMSA